MHSKGATSGLYMRVLGRVLALGAMGRKAMARRNLLRARPAYALTRFARDWR